MGVAIPDATQQAALVEAQCIEQRWLANLYATDSARYKQWIKREQQQVVLQDIVSNPKLLECFNEYCKENACAENTGFIRDVEGFRGLKGDDKIAARRRDGCRIMSTYVTGQKEINIGSNTRANLNAAFDKQCDNGNANIPTSVFDAAFNEVYVLVRGSNLGSFVSSSQFNDCHAKHIAVTDMRNYNVLNQQYCVEERTAFTQGNVDRKTRTFRAILQGWANQCKQNPEFVPQPLAGRGRAAAQANPPPRAANANAN